MKDSGRIWKTCKIARLPFRFYTICYLSNITTVTLFTCFLFVCKEITWVSYCKLIMLTVYTVWHQLGSVELLLPVVWVAFTVMYLRMTFAQQVMFYDGLWNHLWSSGYNMRCILSQSRWDLRSFRLSHHVKRNFSAISLNQGVISLPSASAVSIIMRNIEEWYIWVRCFPIPSQYF